jgi:XTP/dITP diphosphohydrolase
MVHKVVLATGNAGKAKEFASLLGAQFDIVLQTTLGLEPAAETGTTFLENALLKARYAAQQSGLPAIADDSGLEVDALDGAPGVYSARYAGEDASDADNNHKLLEALQNVPAEQRAARFRCVVVYVRNAEDPAPLVARGCWEGAIGTAPSGSGGFGYDPLFCDLSAAAGPAAATLSAARTAAELTAAEKNARSHRGQAVRDLCRQLQLAAV